LTKKYQIYQQGVAKDPKLPGTVSNDDSQLLNSREDSGSEQEREKTETIVELPTMYRSFKSKEEEDKCDP
jgi:hypothetical protein